jgi:hypothetical protein
MVQGGLPQQSRQLTYFRHAQKCVARGDAKHATFDNQSNIKLDSLSDTVQWTLPGTTTNSDGFYTVLDIPAGDHVVKTTFIGFEDQQATITITAGETTVKDFELLPGVNLQEIVVTSQLRGQARALNNQLSNTNITNIIAADQIGRFPDANIGDALKRIPGYQCTVRSGGSSLW